jgi:regulator of protease activity HflC (stomatin/prohibitin superfamily)
MFAALAMTMLTGCSYVKQGEVGVVINKFGDDKGIITEEITQGYIWTGIRKDLVKFPTYKQNYVWTKDPAEGSKNDEAIYFNTSDGLAVDIDLGISYSIVPERADEIFAEYRMGIGEITDKYLRNMVRDEVNVYSSTITCEELYGTGKADFINTVESNFVAKALSKGFIVEELYLIGRPRLPTEVNEAISAKIKATQKAQMRENEVAEAIAQADKDRAQASGQADAYTATEMAKIQVMEAQALVLKENPQLLQWKAMETWDGILPKVTGEVIPFLDMGSIEK